MTLGAGVIWEVNVIYDAAAREKLEVIIHTRASEARARPESREQTRLDAPTLGEEYSILRNLLAY